MKWEEPTVHINGVILTPPHSVMLRLAFEMLYDRVTDPYVLRDDETARAIAGSYRPIAVELREIFERRRV